MMHGLVLLLSVTLPAVAPSTPGARTPVVTAPARNGAVVMPPSPKPAPPSTPAPHRPASGQPGPGLPAAIHPAPVRTGPGRAAPTRPAAPRPAAPRPAAPRPPPVVAAPEPEPEPPAPPTKGSNSGLPLPRFATLRSDEVYMRSGPGPRYPIDWVYKRRDLPVEIEREFDIWRLVRDADGVRGWVNTQTLAPRRSGVVLAGATSGAAVERTLRKEARDDSPAVARLKPGVIVRIRSCDAASEWCAGQVQDFRGYIRRTELWGVYPGEAVQ